jgi:NAD(P)-dependent dehydrogenase (short-subunit alcohol dehydrogenase family)
MAVLLNDFDKQVVAIGGGALGIGRATARAFCERGAKVAIFDIKEEEGRRCAEEVRTEEIKAEFYRCDVTRKADVDRAVQSVLSDFGQIDVLVNVAGGSKLTPIWELSEEDWDAQLNLNLKAAFLCCRAVIPHMRGRRTGNIVNFSSGQGAMPAPQRAPYSAAKAGIIGFTRTAAAELAPYGIRVNAVAPGATNTERVRGFFQSSELMEQQAKTIPLGGFSEPEDIANAVVFLASPLARRMTGQVLFVNGGNFMP